MKSPSTAARFCLVMMLWWAAALSPVRAEPPANNRFASPVVVTGWPATVSGTNVDATLQAGEPLPDRLASDAQASVWFRWTAPIAGPVRIDTTGSDFDTILGVWTGATMGELSEVASNDNEDFDTLQSAVFLEVTAGTTYQIAVYGWWDARGSIRLRLAPDTTSRISGRITGPYGATPLQGITASAYQWNPAGDGGSGSWEWVKSDDSDIDGRYSIRGLSAGTYRVQFSDFGNGDYSSEVFPDAADLDAGRDLVLGAAAEVAGINASLAEASRITGQVTGPDGVTPLEGIEVTVYRWEPDAAGGEGDWTTVPSWSETDAGGRYSIGRLSAGTYRLEFRDALAGDFAFEFYENAGFLETGRDIVVPAATTVTGINVSLARAAFISGRVTGADGSTPLEGITVGGYRWNASAAYWEFTSGAETDAEGRYRIKGLAADNYRVQFFDVMREYQPQVYPVAAGLEAGRDVVVATGATVSDINASLTRFSGVSGRVTGPNGITPLEGIEVNAYQWNDRDNRWKWVSSGDTDATGRYQIGQLPAGRYRIEFVDWFDGAYAVKVYPNAADLDAGQDVVVPVATTVTGINASLATAARLSGRVTGPDGTTPVEGIEVSAFRQQDGGTNWSWMWDAETGPDGRYQLAGLPAGTYRVEFYDPYDEFLLQVYSGATVFEAGRDIVVAAGATVTGIDATLTPVPSLIPPVITVIRAAGAGQFEILYTGSPGQRYTLEASAALGAWSAIGEHTCQSGVNTIPLTDTGTSRFWRLSAAP